MNDNEPKNLGALLDRAQKLTLDIRIAAAGRGPVSHALAVAATHAQDCYAQLLVAGEGGSPGIGG